MSLLPSTFLSSSLCRCWPSVCLRFFLPLHFFVDCQSVCVFSPSSCLYLMSVCFLSLFLSVDCHLCFLPLFMSMLTVSICLGFYIPLCLFFAACHVFISLYFCLFLFSSLYFCCLSICKKFFFFKLSLLMSLMPIMSTHLSPSSRLCCLSMFLSPSLCLIPVFVRHTLSLLCLSYYPTITQVCKRH